MYIARYTPSTLVILPTRKPVSCLPTLISSVNQSMWKSHMNDADTVVPPSITHKRLVRTFTCQCSTAIAGLSLTDINYDMIIIL